MTPALQEAFRQASRLGTQWVGPEHVLLGVLAGPETSVARVVLEGLGVTFGQAEQRFLSSLVGSEPATRSEIALGPSWQPAPVFYEIEGWVAGFAAAHGIGPNDEMALLALCWLLGYPLAQGVARQAVVDALAGQGHPVPPGLVPADQEVGERIDVPADRLSEVIAGLQEAGLFYGFNTDPENNEAWVVVHAGDDRARQLVDSVVAGPQSS